MLPNIGIKEAFALLRKDVKLCFIIVLLVINVYQADINRQKTKDNKEKDDYIAKDRERDIFRDSMHLENALYTNTRLQRALDSSDARL